MIASATRYAIAQYMNITKYPPVHVTEYPVAFCTSTPPNAPNAAPIPTTLPTADRGNMSDVVVNRFADQPWCAAAARLTNPTASQTFFVYGAAISGSTESAHTSIVVFRAALMLHPFLISDD